MLGASLVFPHQLFKNHPALAVGRVVYLVEEYLFFNQYSFHKQKLVLHRASMQYYRNYLENQGNEVIYIEAQSKLADIRKLIPELAEKGILEIHFAEVTDDWLQRRIRRTSTASGIREVVYPTPQFIDGLAAAEAYFKTKKTYFQTDYYIAQRKRLGILLDEEDKPEGGKWTYDSENRARLPKTETIPNLHAPPENEFVAEARSYVMKYYPDNYGSLASPFEVENSFYPTTHDEAEAWLAEFLAVRLGKFGIYEDALVAGEHYLYHSVLSPLINIGLLTPAKVIDKALEYRKANEVPLNSLEGIVRQVLGWREFIRIIYVREGRKQRTTNFWGFTRSIPESFWAGTTGIAPIDNVVTKALQTGYSHHIERLMVIGNFMLLCEFRPDEVYRWFMELYIDAYDWVMVPNVYGMSQFADGDLMCTKPYISGSNYLVKMGDYPKGDWQQIWDSLFWRFMNLHRSFFSRNPRLGMLLRTFDNFPAEKQNKLLSAATTYLDTLDT